MPTRSARKAGTPAPSARSGKRAASAPPRRRAADDGGDSSLNRMLELLDLFTPSAPFWSADALIRYTGTSRSTIYRHLRALHAAGLLRPVANGNYIVGPRVIELDRQLRQTDPLFIAGEVPMKRLVATTGHSALLCALFSDSVMCVREELSPNSPPNLFSRGQKRPLFNGAASKILLPYLPPHQLRSVYSKHKKTIATAGLGSDWDSFRANLAQIRRQGYLVTVGEFNPGLLGLSAPVFNHAGHILGSLGISGVATAFAKMNMDTLARTVQAAADEVTARIGAMDSALDLAPRAIG
ncbi:MAG: IclR family transcriptional regulator [Burkholderiales bacterium]